MLHRRVAKILMLAVLILPVLLPAGIVSAMMFSIIILVGFNPLGNKNNYGFIPFIFPLLLLTLIGSHGFLSHDLYNVFKDIWYFVYPIATLIAGYFLMIYLEDMKSFLKLIVIAAVILACFHIAHFIINPDLIYQNYIDIRNSSAGRGYFIVVVGLAVLLSCWKKFPSESYITNKLLLALIFAILTISIILSFSRTLILALVVLICASWGINGKSNKNQLIFLLLAILMLVSTFWVEINLTQFIGYTDSGFISKFLRSLNEIFISDYSSMEAININWRGYESYKGLQAYSSGNTFNLIAGRGIGFLTDVGFYIKLGEDRLRHIPIFHNGYIFLLVKAGVFGLMMFLIFLFRIIRFVDIIDKKNCPPHIILTARMTFGLTIVILLTTLLIAGFFNKSAMISSIFVLGACLSHLQSYNRSVPDTTTTPDSN